MDQYTLKDWNEDSESKEHSIHSKGGAYKRHQHSKDIIQKTQS